MSRELFKKRKLTDKQQKVLQKELFNTESINDVYQKGNIDQGAVTAGVKCLQFYMESNYAVTLEKDALVKISRISPQLPEPDFDLKSEEEFNAMSKTAQNNYEARVKKFIKQNTGNWFKKNALSVRESLDEISKQKQEYKQVIIENVYLNEQVILAKKAYFEEKDENIKEQLAEDFLEKAVSEAAEYANPEQYKDEYSFAADRADAMRLVVMSSPVADEVLLKSISDYEKKYQELARRKEAILSASALFSKDELKDNMLTGKLREMAEGIASFEKAYDYEGEILEEVILAQLEGRHTEDVSPDEVHKGRLSKYVTADMLKEYRHNVAKEVMNKKWEKDTSSSEKAGFILSAKTESIKKVMQEKQKKARELSVKNEVEKNGIHDEKDTSLASYEMVVTLSSAEKYKRSSNGFITYVPLEEQPGLYVLKATLPMEAAINKADNPFNMDKYSPRIGHNTFIRHFVTRLEKLGNETDADKHREIQYGLEDFLNVKDVESYLRCLGMNAQDVSEEELENIRHAICYMTQCEPMDVSMFTSFIDFVDKCKSFDNNAPKLKNNMKELIKSSGSSRPGTDKFFRQICEYLNKKYFKDGKATPEFEKLLERCVTEAFLNKDKEYEELMALKNLKADSEVIPIFNECRSNSLMLSKVGRNVDKSEGELEKELKYARMQYIFASFEKEENKEKYYEYLKTHFKEYYDEIVSIKDPEKQKKKFMQYMKAVSTFEFHFVPKVGETDTELLSIEGFAPEISDLFISPLTMSPAIGIYQKNGEKPDTRVIKTEDNYKPISSVNKYYDRDAGLVTSDLGLMNVIAKLFF